MVACRRKSCQLCALPHVCFYVCALAIEFASDLGCITFVYLTLTAVLPSIKNPLIANCCAVVPPFSVFPYLDLMTTSNITPDLLRSIQEICSIAHIFCHSFNTNDALITWPETVQNRDFVTPLRKRAANGECTSWPAHTLACTAKAGTSLQFLQWAIVMLTHFGFCNYGNGTKSQMTDRSQSSTETS